VQRHNYDVTDNVSLSEEDKQSSASDEWDKMDQQLIDRRHKRVTACVSARGGQPEHTL